MFCHLSISHYLFIIINSLYYTNYSSYLFCNYYCITFSVILFVLSKINNQKYILLDVNRYLILFVLIMYLTKFIFLNLQWPSNPYSWYVCWLCQLSECQYLQFESSPSRLLTNAKLVFVSHTSTLNLVKCKHCAKCPGYTRQLRLTTTYFCIEIIEQSTIV